MKKRATILIATLFWAPLPRWREPFIFAKYVLSEKRRFGTPQPFETLMFLKINTRFWDAALVEEAIGKKHRIVTCPTKFEMMILTKRSSSDFQ